MQHILDDRPLPEKKTYRLKPVSDKRAAKIAAQKEERGGEETELVKWYKARMRQMSGVCTETGRRTETKKYEFAIASICHILPKEKNGCPSVATHSLNWIELHSDMHTKFDAMSWEERRQMKCWPIIEQRLIAIEPDLLPEERRRLPDFMKDKFELPFK